MIIDKATNFLYLSDLLPFKYPGFWGRFEKILKECNVEYGLLPATKDVWAVDFMPVQVRDNHFVQFSYNPDYLQTAHYRKTISDVDAICRAINISPQKSPIVLDGGNVIKWEHTVIMTDKVFKENKNVDRDDLIYMLCDLFELHKLYFIPEYPNDFTGHADGMIRFLNEDTVLINDCTRESPEFKFLFLQAIRKAGLKYIEVPYAPSLVSKYSAKGVYLNFLEMDGLIFLPVFNIKQDEIAIKLFEELFQGYTIKTIESNELAVHGGVLNCIGWNIKNKIDLEFDWDNIPWEGGNWYNSI